MLSTLWRAARLATCISPWAAATTAILGILSGTAAAPATWLTKRLIDELTNRTHPPSAASVGLLAAEAAFLAGLAGIAASASGIAGTRLQAKVQLETETTLAATCAEFTGTSFLDDPAQHDRLHLAQRGAHDAPALVTSSAVECFSSIATIGSFAVVLWVSWPAMLIAMALTAVPAAIIQRNMSLRAVAVARSATASYRWRDYYSQLFTSQDTARDMRLFGSQRLFVQRLRHNLAVALGQETRQQARAAWSQILYTLINAAIAAAGAAFLAIAVARGRVTVGDFVLFTAAVTIVQARLASLLRLAGTVSVSLGVFAYYLAFTADDHRGHTPPITASAPVSPLRSGIEFRHVWFRYRADTAWVLRDVSIRLDAGQTHALVGLNGAGKSTLVKLLLRFNEPTRGQILWDNVDVSSMDAESLRRRMAGVLQDYVAYELSAVENITLGNLDHLGDIPSARGAARSAGVLDVIDSLPAGMLSMLSTSRNDRGGKVGTSLSGGQWQRIALARAMMRPDADLLILDEPNSGLDPAAEYDLHTNLMRLGAGRTRLLISHRLGALRAAHQIIVLDHGQVREAGTHEQLMMQSGDYARLFNLQASPYVGTTTLA